MSWLQRSGRSPKRGDTDRSASNPKKRSIVKTVLKVTVAAVAIAGATWVAIHLFRVIRHRRLAKREDYVLNDTYPLDDKESPRFNYSTLKPGDFIFSRVRPFKRQPALSWMRHPMQMIKINATDLPAILSPPIVPTHIAVIIKVDYQKPRDSLLVELNFHGVRVISLATFMEKRRQAGAWDIHIATLSRRIPNNVSDKLVSLLTEEANRIKGFRWKHITPMLNRGKPIMTTRSAMTKTAILAMSNAKTGEEWASSKEGLSCSSSGDSRPSDDGSINHFPVVCSSITPIGACTYIDNWRGTWYDDEWRGMISATHTCSSLAYAIFEYAGLVLPFTRPYEFTASNPIHGKVIPLHITDVDDDDDNDSDHDGCDNEQLSSRNRLCEVYHPTELLPHSFLRKRFQWCDGVRVTGTYKIRDEEFWIIDGTRPWNFIGESP